jgi:ABC-type multidrug transport system fused ATPase/permease subunit
VSLRLPPGGRLAIVGPSGAGKSTLLHVLLRFWDCPPAQLWLAGRDAREYSADAVRRQLTVVAQQTYLFHGTVAQNLRVARPEATEAELHSAAQRAQLHDFITALPEGYETWIGERGLRLSGGQRQRLALARALLRPAPLLVLDEPTASLDPETERAVLHTLLTAAPDRGVLLVTHRLVGLDHMDEIIVLDHGRVVQRGRHAELVEVDGLYRRLWRLQRGAEA